MKTSKWKKAKNPITKKRIQPETDWIDITGKELKFSEMDDKYVFDLCYFLSNGGEWDCERTADVINDVFCEAMKRSLFLKSSDKWSDLYTNAIVWMSLGGRNKEPGVSIYNSPSTMSILMESLDNKKDTH
jgi:hypothetical protein